MCNPIGWWRKKRTTSWSTWLGKSSGNSAPLWSTWSSQRTCRVTFSRSKQPRLCSPYRNSGFNHYHWSISIKSLRIECLYRCSSFPSPFVQRGQVKDFVSGAALLRRCSSEQTMAVASTLDRSFARRVFPSGWQWEGTWSTFQSALRQKHDSGCRVANRYSNQSINQW